MSKENFTLLAGSFTASEAKEILLNLIDDKIKFHNKKNLKSLEHTAQQDAFSNDRVQKLKESRNMIIEMMDKAPKDKHFKLSSIVSIEAE
jgi:hypothetical protein